MTAHNNRNESNSRNEINNRTANTVGMEAKVGLLAKVVKQQRGGRPATAGTVLTAEMTTAAGKIGTSWITTAVGLPESDSRNIILFSIGANFAEICEKVIRMAIFVKKDTKKK